jgi:hypothetical protein
MAQVLSVDPRKLPDRLKYGPAHLRPILKVVRDHKGQADACARMRTARQ